MIKRLICWLLTLAGLAILIWLLSLLIQSRTALRWPHTKAQVIASSLTIKHFPKFLDLDADPIRWYGTDVQYQYVVDGGLYISNRLAVRGIYSRNPQDALNTMNQYRHHHEVLVFYDPKDPQNSYLDPGNIGDIFMPVMAAGLLIFLGLFFLHEQTIEIRTGGREEHLQRGNLYLNQGKFDEALSEYNKYISICSSLAIGYVSRGNLYLEKGNWDPAIADFNKAVTIDPTDAFVYFRRGKAYLGNKQYDKASADMQKAMEKGFNVKPEILDSIKKGL